jgi:glutamate-1-semialdehyde 2,1-aminomutase
MLGGFFAEGPVTDYASAKKSDTAKFGKFFHVMLNQGIYLAPSQFEAMLLSTAHSTSQIRHTVSAARQAFKML